VAVEVASLLTESERPVARRAARVLGDLGVRRPEVLGALAAASASTDTLLSTEASLSLALLGDPRGLEGSRRALSEGLERARAALALGALGDRSAVPGLTELVTAAGTPESVRDRAVAALQALRDPRSLGAWEHLLGDPRLAPEAARALGALGEPSASEALRGTLSSTPYPLTRRACAGALVALHAPGSEALALEALGGEAPLPDAFGLLALLHEPGRRVAGSRRPRRVTGRGVRLSLEGANGVVTRLYLLVEASQPTTMTVGPWGLPLEVPAGSRELTVEVPRGRRPGALYLRAGAPVTVRAAVVR
jgi:HEAT repeat protein